tara:strand:+ start:1190 stop:2299 length:1110 start_codon:yes stop_codon:yes gene_type:complete
MKIFILEGDLNNSISGLRSHFVNKMMNLGHKVHVVGGSSYKSNFRSKTNYNNEKIKVKKVNFNTFNPLILLKNLIIVFNLCLKYKPEHVLVYNIRPLVFWGILNKFLKISSTCTITGTITYTKNGKIRYLYKQLIDLTLKEFNFVVFQNQIDSNLFKKIGSNNKQKRHIINGSGVDIEYFKNDYKSKKIWDFIFIGRVLKDKGILEYLKASKKILSKYPNTKFSIIGPFYRNSKNNSHLTLNDIKKYLNKNVIYLGESNDIKKHLSNSKCLVLPSYGEGFSNVLLEAGSMELPLITTNVPGCREIVINKFNGLLCKPRNVLHLTKKIELFINLSNKEKLFLGKNSRKHIVKNFSKKHIVNKYLSLLNLK